MAQADVEAPTVVQMAGFDEANARRICDWLSPDNEFCVLEADPADDLHTALIHPRADVAFVADEAIAGADELATLLQAGAMPVLIGMLDHRAKRANALLHAGASAVVPLISASSAQLCALLALGAQGLLGSTTVLSRTADPFARLSPRLREVASLIAAGVSPKEIAERLWVTRGTVREYRRRIYRTLGVQSSDELAGLLGVARQPLEPEHERRFASPRPLGCRRLASTHRSWARPTPLHMGAALGVARWRGAG